MTTAGLRLFRPWAEAHPRKDFGDWFRIVTVNLARDHVSSRLGVAERADDDVPFNKRMLSSLAARLPDAEDERICFRPSMTQRQLARGGKLVHVHVEVRPPDAVRRIVGARGDGLEQSSAARPPRVHERLVDRRSARRDTPAIAGEVTRACPLPGKDPTT